MPMAQPGQMCTLIEGFLKPGVEDWFDGQCVPQIQAQVDACNGQLQSEVQQMADQMCGGVSSQLEALISKIPVIKNILGPMFAPNGFFQTQCDTDLGSYLLQQVQQQCASIQGLNAQVVCNEAFGEMWSEITGMINSKICKS